MYVLDIDVTRNGNNLKLKVKSEFSLSMGLMVINHSNPYIHSTTVLCDNLKLKVKSEFSLSMGLMVINHSNPYIHSTTVLCDNNCKPDWKWHAYTEGMSMV